MSNRTFNSCLTRQTISTPPLALRLCDVCQWLCPPGIRYRQTFSSVARNYCFHSHFCSQWSEGRWPGLSVCWISELQTKVYVLQWWPWRQGNAANERRQTVDARSDLHISLLYPTESNNNQWQYQDSLYCTTTRDTPTFRIAAFSRERTFWLHEYKWI